MQAKAAGLRMRGGGEPDANQGPALEGGAAEGHSPAVCRGCGAFGVDSQLFYASFINHRHNPNRHWFHHL